MVHNVQSTAQQNNIFICKQGFSVIFNVKFRQNHCIWFIWTCFVVQFNEWGGAHVSYDWQQCGRNSSEENPLPDVGYWWSGESPLLLEHILLQHWGKSTDTLCWQPRTAHTCQFSVAEKGHYIVDFIRKESFRQVKLKRINLLWVIVQAVNMSSQMWLKERK